MALTTIKTWDHQYMGLINRGNVDLNNRDVMYRIKEGLITGPGAWTVVSSSDSVTADATDRWTD